MTKMLFKISTQLFNAKKEMNKICICKFANFRKDFGKYNIVMPEIVSEKLYVPRYIKIPPYLIKNKKQEIVPAKPEIKSVEDINNMRNSCFLARYILDLVAKEIKIGITTDELDKIAHRLCIENNAYPSPLGYNGFPKSICTSVNNVACHGIPDNRPLKNGDIINIDVSVFYNGFHGDCSNTYAVGNVDSKGLDLISATEQCLADAISICYDGQDFCNIGHVISESAKSLGYNVIPCFAGHGIGPYFHGPPDIFHCDNDYPGQMKTGMTFTIEPVLTQGEPEIIILEDGWTAITIDNARTAQFEHTILINRDRAEVLT